MVINKKLILLSDSDEEVRRELNEEASSHLKKNDKSNSSLVINDEEEFEIKPRPPLQKKKKKTLVQTTLLPNGKITPLKLNKYSEDRAIGGYSPNSFPVKVKDEKKPNITSGIKMMSMDDTEQDKKMAARPQKCL